MKNAMGDEYVETTASWFVDGWGDAYHRLAGMLWDHKPPESYLKEVAYCLERVERAQKREDEQRIAAGVDPLWKNNIMGGYMEEDSP